MAQFKGRDELIKNLSTIIKDADRKGLLGEIEVGGLLSTLLPDDTYLIAHPEIGELHPDFLVISPNYGFRVIEVKNMRLYFIEQALSNGTLVTNFGNMNPFKQVKNHADLLKHYLLSNHLSHIRTDPYRNIGYCVVHKGFTKKEFTKKFADQISKWSTKEREDYFKYHIFFDQLDEGIEQLIIKATKFQNTEFLLSGDQIKNIVTCIRISAENVSDDKRYDAFAEQEEKIEHVHQEVRKMKEELKNNKSMNKSFEEVNASVSATNAPVIEDMQRKKPAFNIVAPILAILILVFAFTVIYDAMNTDKVQESVQGNSNPNNEVIMRAEEEQDRVDIITNYSDLANRIGESVEIDGLVTRFFYHEESGTKFLTITDGDNNLDAIVFKDTQVRFIEEGKVYTFAGKIQSAKNNDGVEIIVRSVK